MDIIIWYTPLPIFWGMHMHKRKRLQVCGLFLVGFMFVPLTYFHTIAKLIVKQRPSILRRPHDPTLRTEIKRYYVHISVCYPVVTCRGCNHDCLRERPAPASSRHSPRLPPPAKPLLLLAKYVPLFSAAPSSPPRIGLNARSASLDRWSVTSHVRYVGAEPPESPIPAGGRGGGGGRRCRTRGLWCWWSVDGGECRVAGDASSGYGFG